MKQLIAPLLTLCTASGISAQSQPLMETNKNAPLHFRHEIVINATPEQVWSVLADMEKWPAWNTDVAFLTLNGGLTPGTQFVWKEKGAKPISYLQSVVPNRQLGWTGKATGLSAVHVFTLKPQNGGTLVVQEESLEGWLVTVLKPIVRKIGNSGMTHWNNALKQRVEGTPTALLTPGR
ncbi:SRPBCC domain-containing protein [Fibrella aquatilis]|uniref:SRPBCC domain-containing protein n=1 Tax=Fibrella aquatilis TaxID=2817059 RepID=A0A939G462_9BACT|nr:SRPBCC domain-containing protein [Fibrella aquatilis]MBO0930883.1 SRPBCC domain-containing protein [Fibrella aquatilis]